MVNGLFGGLKNKATSVANEINPYTDYVQDARNQHKTVFENYSDMPENQVSAVNSDILKDVYRLTVNDTKDFVENSYNGFPPISSFVIDTLEGVPDTAIDFNDNFPFGDVEALYNNTLSKKETNYSQNTK